LKSKTLNEEEKSKPHIANEPVAAETEAAEASRLAAMAHFHAASKDKVISRLLQHVLILS
jgi:hypothetical protein